MSRFACVRVACFAAAALERCEPALRAAPLAVLSGAPPTGRVVEANAVARESGIRPGMTEAEARARDPFLVGCLTSPGAVTSARHALLEATLAVSPRVEDAGEGVACVDTTGLARSMGDARAIAERLVGQAKRAGLEATVGMAGSRTAARLAAALASQAERIVIVAAGTEAAALARAPLGVLGLEADLAATFRQWGIATLGELAALPRAGLGVRLGAAGLRAHDLASGRDRTPFVPYTPPPYWAEAQGLDWEIDTLPALGAVLTRVLERLCARLRAGHVAADVLDVSLGLATGQRHERTLPLASPMREAAPMLTLVALALERHPPPAAVTDLAVSAHAVPYRPGQGGLWRPPAPALRDLATVLARLARLVGAENVGAARPGDTHRPDAFTLDPFRPDAAEPGSPPVSAGDEGGALALRRVRPPRPLAVEVADGQPVRVFWSAQRGTPVLRQAGPWRVSGDWWDSGAWARDEWDVALADGTLCRLARDLLSGTWLLDGIYD